MLFIYLFIYFILNLDMYLRQTNHIYSNSLQDYHCYYINLV